MPLYDFECSKCGVTEEHLVNSSDIDLQVCGICGGSVERQLVTRVFFREFKPQLIEGVDDTTPVTGFGDLKRRAKSWKNDEEQKLLVDCAPTSSEQKVKIDVFKDRERDKHQKLSQNKKNQ